MEKVISFFRMIKVEHTLFALPFAFTGAIIAAKGIPSIDKIFWIAVAMLGARSGAMGFNRVADAEIDAKNPRTANREIPAGKISKKEAIIYIIISFLLYFLAAYKLNPLCFKLSPIPVIIFILYSYTKRFTFLCHLILGIALGLAPMGAWVAITGSIDFRIVLLGVGVMFWVAGFDLIYAIQDIDFDREHNLFSIPRFIGIKNSIYLARAFHLIAFVLFLYAKFIFNLGILYLIGVILCGLFMIYEHSIIKPNDLSKLDMAFFNLNAYISLTIFVFTFFDVVVL
ncbi:4-hydroxybenzoate polyprenyltransferase [Deferribacter desulfuricans SSM1]|uniref:4-hydroxybenzoate polyprenyltransferase n=1 Tax=Deferribacter desulfuricans (strain DSM 14783 / JCM 11476 / NBRC 101012 / SSM1) TaxID=639282 RepID=D3PB48_DEFDS|nr:UbiA-like polyprenyltransferase [Deferribacter desulfuricans]BAI79821.1 4-hydroxybenzoate polyprenyltransferase [Deferribacter desulfuricans SSM1]